jgi:hypothetical protein
MTKYPRFITMKDYDQMHQNGNRCCFDFFSEYEEEIHFRLVDGDQYEYEKDGRTVKEYNSTYILMSWEEEEEGSADLYLELNIKQAFDLLASFNALILYAPPGHKAENEATFIEKCYDLLSEAEEKENKEK